MDKLLNHIKESTGIGALYLLIFSCFAAFVITFLFRQSQVNLPERLQDTADQILPIQIRDGHIVEPDNIVKNATFNIFDNASYNERLKIHIDTTTDSINTAKLRPGIYITRTALHLVDSRQVKTTYFTNSLDIPAGDYRPLFEQILDYAVIVVFLFSFMGFLFYCFIACLFYAGCGAILSKILKRTTDFDFRMRLSVICWIGLKVLIFLLSLMKIYVGGLGSFAAMIAAMAIIIGQLPQEEKPQEENK